MASKTFLNPISHRERLILNPTDGKATIASARTVFRGGIDSNFMNWGCNIEGPPTSEQEVQVYELIVNGTFEEIYAGIGDDLNTMCLSQGQIIQFMENHRKWLGEAGYSTFILFKVEDEFFVTAVFVHAFGHLEANVYRLSRGSKWNAECRPLFVLPL